MKIFHVASFAPHRCGIYEAARDMIKADVLSGHEVYFIDAGFTVNEKREYVDIGTVDDRGGFKIVVSNPSNIDFADIIVVHNMPPFAWFVKNQASVVYIIHDRPLASFRTENNNSDIQSYTFIHDVAKWPRVKKMVYFWPEFKPFWDTILLEEKQGIFEYPVIDRDRFSPDGRKHIIKDENRGDFNILLCDSWREDVDMFEIFNGVIQAARDNKNFKLHFYGLERPMKTCWEVLIQELYKLNAMGELYIRMPDMDTIYRSMDAVLTPHKIITRIIGESLSCGIPVIASNGCKVSQFHCNPHDAHSVSKAIKEYINSDKVEVKKDALEQSKNFNFNNYSITMNKIYNDIMKK